MNNGQAICSAWYRTTNPKTVLSDDDFAHLVKMVDKGQLDAFKAGMTRATQILQKQVSTCHGGGKHDDCMPCVARNNSTIDILAERDNLTIDQLHK